MGENTAQQLDKAIASINKGADKKEEMRLMMEPYANWDSLLSPAPLSIALLGQLILISSDTDFSLQDEEKSITFELLKYPDSFRACLVQVSNKGWNAFNKAHTSMDQIRLYSSNVDKHVKTAVKFLIAGSAQDVEMMVPNSLKSIEQIANNCVDLATSVEEEFVSVMQLIGELLEACTRAKGQQEEKYRAAKIAREVAEEHKKAIEVEKEQALERQKKMESEMGKAEEEFKEAMKSMPGAWNLMGKACADAFVSAARTVSSLPGVLMGKLGVTGGSSQAASQPNEAATGNANPGKSSDSTVDICKRVPVIHREVNKLEQFASDGKVMKGDQEATEGVLYVKTMLQSIMETQVKEANDSEMKTKVGNLCRDAIELSEKLLSMGKKMAANPEKEIQEAKQKATRLREKAEVLQIASHCVLSTNSLPNTSPNLAKQQVYSNDSGLVEQELNDYRYRTETAKEMLKDSRRTYEKSCDDAAKSARELAHLLAEIKELDLKEVDIEKIRQTLVKGIKALAELREQWGKLVKFFQMLSNIVKCILSTSLKKFVETSQTRLGQGDSVMSAVMRDAIFEQAFQANQIAYVVNSISSVYVEVSHKYLMEPVTCLGKLIALDPAHDKHEIMLKREELNQGCEDAQHAIRTIALNKKKEMMEAIDRRIERIEKEVEALLPPISKQKAQEIQQNVKAGIAMGKAELEAEVDELT